MEYINLTPHEIAMNDGRTFAPSDIVARVGMTYTNADSNGIAKIVTGKPTDVPEPANGVIYIVSALVASAMPHRPDVVSPASGHPEAKRNEKGHIVSVPFFVKEDGDKIKDAFYAGGNYEVFGEDPQITFKFSSFEEYLNSLEA